MLPGVLSGRCPLSGSPEIQTQAGSNASGSAPRPGKGTSPDIATVKGEYDDTYHASYVPPHKGHPASIVVSMHLEGSDAVKNGSGSFRTRTPRGKVLVKWGRGYGALGKNEGGAEWDNSTFSEPTYTLTIDSPKALLVQLKTQEHNLWSVSLNGAFVPLAPHLSGEVSHWIHETQYFTVTFPGGHNVVVIQALVYSPE